MNSTNKKIKYRSKQLITSILLGIGLLTSTSSYALFGIFEVKSSRYIDKPAFKYFKEILGEAQNELPARQAINKLDGSKIFLGAGAKDIEGFIFTSDFYKISNINGAKSKYGQIQIKDIAFQCKNHENFASPSDILSNNMVVYYVSTIRYYICSQFISWNNIIEVDASRN